MCLEKQPSVRKKTPSNTLGEPVYLPNQPTPSSPALHEPGQDDVFLHAPRDPVCSTLAQDNDSPLATSSPFFDHKSSEMFSSSTLSSSQSPSDGRVMFPRKLPEINSKSDDNVDHRAVAIKRLHEVLEGIKLFDR